jgi:thiol-disulfide isomerase/thioredoxin
MVLVSDGFIVKLIFISMGYGMAATYSTMMPLGTQAPDFNLFDSVTGLQLSLQTLRGNQATLIMFICNHCPYVLHVKEQLIAIAEQYLPKGVSTIAISSNDIVAFPQDAPDKMRALSAEWGNPFDAYLFDQSQAVAKAYQAACTPDFFLFDSELKCVYRGRLDAATPKNNLSVTGDELRNALDALLSGTPVNPEQIPSIGCNIKWQSL